MSITLLRQERDFIKTMVFNVTKNYLQFLFQNRMLALLIFKINDYALFYEALKKMGGNEDGVLNNACGQPEERS